MKKLVLILTLAAFACCPLVQTEVQAAPMAKMAAKHAKKNHKKVNHKNKKGGRKHHKKG